MGEHSQLLSIITTNQSSNIEMESIRTMQSSKNINKQQTVNSAKESLKQIHSEQELLVHSKIATRIRKKQKVTRRAVRKAVSNYKRYGWEIQADV